MSDLIEFLRARLDEDEQTAREAAQRSAHWESDGRGVVGGEAIPGEPEGGLGLTGEHTIVYDEGWPEAGEAIHIARHDPARVLREIEAKRHIVDRYEAAVADFHRHLDGGANPAMALARMDIGQQSARELAAVYAEHADYRPEWAS